MPIELKKGAELRGRYVISDYIAAGGFGIVYRATDKTEGRDVAIKRMIKQDGNENQRLLDEARKTTTLKGHTNIVEVYEVFEEGGEGFLVMEYVDGASLDTIFKQHIQARTWLDEDEAIDYFKQTLQALVYAHSSGVFHRDIKPANILVSKLGVVKLVDFGLARLMNQPISKYVGEPGFAWTGTPNFMSPEQANGGELDHQTDIFSAGLLGYILFTSRHPFNHSSGVTSVFELIKDSSFECPEVSIPISKRISEGFVKSLGRMLQKDKTRRCQSVVEPLSELTKEAAQSCSKCGAPNAISNSFCGQCGNPLNVVTAPIVPLVTNGAAKVKSASELTDEGFALTQLDDWDGAIAAYKKAIDINPKYDRVYSNLGYALNNVGRYEEAIQCLTKGIDLTDKDNRSLLHRAFDYRGFAKSKLKDYLGAIEDFSSALNFNSRNPRVFHHRAESKALAGQYESAYLDVLQALKLDFSYQPAIRLKQKLELQGGVNPL